jgi:hypothetical protein
MKSQRGSLLAGAISLAMIMTLAGAGFLMVSAQSHGEADRTLSHFKVQHVAEAGLLMGMRFTSVYWDSSYLCTAYPPHDLTGGWIAFDDHSLRVKLELESGMLTFTSWATKGAKQDTIRMKWSVDSVRRNNPCAGCRSRLVMKTYSDTLFPGK